MSEILGYEHVLLNLPDNKRTSLEKRKKLSYRNLYNVIWILDFNGC